jgi:hypothetical protein
METHLYYCATCGGLSLPDPKFKVLRCVGGAGHAIFSVNRVNEKVGDSVRSIRPSLPHLDVGAVKHSLTVRMAPRMISRLT